MKKEYCNSYKIGELKAYIASLEAENESLSEALELSQQAVERLENELQNFKKPTMNKAKLFEEKYSNKEVKLPLQVCVIKDNYPSPFSSGSNGYIKKLRVKNGRLEYYLDWWNYGWYDADDGKYPRAIEEALNQLL